MISFKEYMNSMVDEMFLEERNDFTDPDVVRISRPLSDIPKKGVTTLKVSLMKPKSREDWETTKREVKLYFVRDSEDRSINSINLVDLSDGQTLPRRLENHNGIRILDSDKDGTFQFLFLFVPFQGNLLSARPPRKVKKRGSLELNTEAGLDRGRDVVFDGKTAAGTWLSTRTVVAAPLNSILDAIVNNSKPIDQASADAAVESLAQRKEMDRKKAEIDKDKANFYGRLRTPQQIADEAILDVTRAAQKGAPNAKIVVTPPSSTLVTNVWRTGSWKISVDGDEFVAMSTSGNIIPNLEFVTAKAKKLMMDRDDPFRSLITRRSK